MKTLRNTYFAILDSHLIMLIVFLWTQNNNTVSRLIILQLRPLKLISFKDQLFNSRQLFSTKTILKFGDKITLQNIIFSSKSVNGWMPWICYNWFTFSGKLHRCDTFWSSTNLLKPLTVRTQKHGHFSVRASAIRSSNSTQDLLQKNLPLKNSTWKQTKYFLTRYFTDSY